MTEAARREVARSLRVSGVVPRSQPAVWAVDWVEVEAPLGEGAWRLGVWLSSTGPLAVPAALGIDDFSLEATNELPAPGWLLSDLKVDEAHVTLRLSRSPAAGPWTDASIVLVYHGTLGSDAGGGVDPLRDRHEVVFSRPAPPPVADSSAPLAGDQAVGDYNATRAGLLQRLALTAPEWQERSEADPWIVLLDLLAWAGDQLAGYQDAVATEAWLATARRRLSVCRHARLLGFVAHEGCSSRAWLHVDPDAELTLPVGARFASKANFDAEDAAVRVLHVLEEVVLSPALERLVLYRWGAATWTLAAGSKHFAVEGDAAALGEGRVLLLPGLHVARVAHLAREKDPLTGRSITRVELFAHDALPAAIEVTGADASVSANVVLVGEGSPFEFGEPPEVGRDGRLRYPLRGRRLAYSEPFDPDKARCAPAAQAIHQTPEHALPDVAVREHRPGGRVLRWEPRRDLLDSGPYDRHVVVELDDDVVQLRFGDGVHGRPAPAAALLRVSGRTAGAAKDVAAPGTPVNPVDDPARSQQATLVREGGGVEPMSSSHVRLRAPVLATDLEVCATAADYARHARQVRGVLDAHAEIRWTGSWYTAFVWVLPEASDVLGPDLAQAVHEQLAIVRMLGVDLDVRPPRYVIGEIALDVDLEPGAAPAAVERELGALLGTGGLFARSAFRLGTSLSCGKVVAAASGVRGVREVRVRRFRREDDPGEHAGDWITVGRDEVLRVGVGQATPVTLALSIP